LERWEHKEISVAAGELATLSATIEDLGCYGWELAGLAPAQSANSGDVIAILKRPMVLPHDPHDRGEGWKPDPCGRWETRWWDGQTWTFYVERHVDGETRSGRDAPTMQPVFRKPQV